MIKGALMNEWASGRGAYIIALWQYRDRVVAHMESSDSDYLVHTTKDKISLLNSKCSYHNCIRNFFQPDRFKLRSGNPALPKDRPCDEYCKEDIKNKTQKIILDEAKTISDIFKQVIVVYCPYCILTVFAGWFFYQINIKMFFVFFRHPRTTIQSH